MADTNSYEILIYEAIASSLGMDISNLRGLPSVIPLPGSDYDLFQLLDLVPSRSPTIEVNASAHRLSVTYGEMLNSMPDSLIVSMARENYAKAAYWLPADPRSGQPKTPIYSPTSADVTAAVAHGSTLQYELDSSSYPPHTPILYPSFPSMVINLPLLGFNRAAESNRFIFNMRFGKVASPVVRAGGWFSQAAFVSGYQSQGKGWKTGPNTVTWDELFGAEGILQFITNGLLAVSGVTVTLQCFGGYDQATLNLLRSSKGTAAWPYYLNVPTQTQSYELGEDGSLTITTVVPASEVLLFLLLTSGIKAGLVSGRSA
jgi:hypothetical protein